MTFNVDNEALRQIYLQKMGIQPWFPRYSLPHAAQQRTYPAGVMLPQTTVAPDVSVDDTKADSAILQSTLKEIVAPAAAPRVKQTTVLDTAPQASEAMGSHDAQPHFAFSYLTVSSHLAVICEIPYQSRGRLQAPVREILAKILEALGIAVQPGATPVIHFQWPLQETNEQEQGLENARQTIHGFLARQLRDRPVPLLLVFSEQWPDWLFPANYLAENEQQLQGLLQHPHFATRVLVTRGLHAMLADEALKKPAWIQMKSLKVELDALAKSAAGTQQHAEGQYD